MKNYAFLLTGWLLAAGCDSLMGPDETVPEEVATAFADAWFNYDLTRAQRFATPESRRWIEFAASNVSQQTIDVLNQRDEDQLTKANVMGSDVVDDSTVVARIRVENVLEYDSIGQAGTIHDAEDYALTVVNRDGKWMVRMEGLPRNEKHSRD